MLVFPASPTNGQSFVASNGAAYIYVATTNNWELNLAPANSYYTRAQSDASYLKITGGSLTGPVTLAADPTSNKHAATKEYVDSAAISAGNGTPVDLANYLTTVAASNTYLPLNGGTITGQIISPEPLYPVHLATRNYVDTNIGNAILAVNAAQYITQAQATTQFAGINQIWQISSINGLQATINTMMSLGGGTLVGALYLYEDPILPTEAATKNYIDSHVTTLNTTISARALLSHTHQISDIENLQVDLALLAPLTATWNMSSVTGLQAALSNKINTSDHIPISQITNLTVQLAGFLPLVGGQMAGNLILNGDPSQTFQAVTKHYVDSSITSAILTLPTSTAIIDTSPPTRPINGNLWWDSANGILYIYYNDGVSAQFVPTTPSITSLGNYLLKTGGVVNGTLQVSAEFDVLDNTANHGIRMRGNSTNGGYVEAYNTITGIRETLALSPNGGAVTAPNATAASHVLNQQSGDSRYALLTGAAFLGSVSFGGSATFNAASTFTQPVTLANTGLTVASSQILVLTNSLPMSTGATSAQFVAASSDTGASMILFNRTQTGNASSAFVGLDSDNIFKIGGGSWSPQILTLDSAGNFTTAASVKSPNIFCTSLITDAFFGLYTNGLSLLMSFMTGYDLELDSISGNYSLRQNGNVILSTSSAGCINIIGSTPFSYSNFGYLNSSGVSTLYSGSAISKSVSLNASSAVVASEFDAVSDERLKTDVEIISPDFAEQFVRSARPISYTFRSDRNRRKRFGYLAQDMIKQGYSELVSLVDARDDEIIDEFVDNDGFTSPKNKKFTLSMDYATPLHGAVLKIALERIEVLENKIKSLQEKI